MSRATMRSRCMLYTGLTWLLYTVAALASPCTNSASIKVKTTSGELTGFINSTAPAVRQFLGVPYAEPPLERLRFQPPQRKQESGPINTTAYAPACMQQISTSPTVYTEYIQQFLINGGQSEDCLYVDVYAPLHPTSGKLPVFIYIPGGAFTSGGSNSLYKIPDKWIQRTQSHIVIVMQYRLNVFGFPNAEGAHQNVGLLDQRMVVEWARDNVAAFGGNASQMVLWGQSAGAGSVGMYGYSYPDDLIVKGLISDSGAASILTQALGNYTSFSTLASLVGCGDLGAMDELECMQKVDARTIESVYSTNTGVISFSPVADNVTAFSNTTDRLASGLVTKAPWIMGNNANEGAGFGTFNATGESEAQFDIGLSLIVCPVSTEIRTRAQYDYTTYRYYYTGNFSNISPLPWVGATHSAELPLLFGTHYEYRGNSTEFEWETSYGMEALWLSFASNPDQEPTDGNGVTWPKYNPSTSSMVEFAADDKWIQFVSGSVDDSLCS
ncbi:Alpha/Beta hydrolase protein [Xylariales sp. AK1849]|nr:Alpha/Beta hydrolase protein [Xylariales sp. AK1849]